MNPNAAALRPVGSVWLLPMAAAMVAFGVALAGVGQELVWHLIRASGVVAYLLLSLSVIGGLVMSTGLVAPGERRATLFEAHRFITFLVIAFSLLHAGALLFDSFIGFSPLQIAVPFTSSYRPLAVGAGTMALYAGIALYLSFYLRRRIGMRVWRALHYGTFGFYLLATLHGVFSGSDSSTAWMTGLYLVSLAAVATLTLLRVLPSLPVGDEAAEPAQRQPTAQAEPAPPSPAEMPPHSVWRRPSA